MKLHLNEADSDYVQFGKLRIPKDMSGMGYDDFSTAARKGQQAYDAEQKAKADAQRKKEEEEKRARLAETGKKDYDRFMKIIHSGAPIENTQEKLSELFEEFVPAEGQCENLGAELIRAMNRVGYRNWNDGDYFFTGYGLETCGPDMAYIYDNVDDERVTNDIDKAADLVNYMYDDDEMSKKYEPRIMTVFADVIDWMMDHPEIFATETPDSRYYESGTLDQWTSNSKNCDYEVDTYRASEMVEKGWITWEKVEENIKGWVDSDIRQGEVRRAARDYYVIEELDREGVAMCDDMIPGWMDQWLDEVESEHEGEDDEDGYDDEEDYDEEDYDEE